MLLRSLTARTATAIASVVAVVVLLNAVGLSVSKRAEMRHLVEERVRVLARLTHAELARPVHLRTEAARRGLAERARELLAMTSAVSRIRVTDREGRVRFDSEDVLPAAALALLDDADLRAAAGRAELTLVRGGGASAVVAPWLDARGGHELSVVYDVDYRDVAESGSALLRLTVGSTAAAILASVLVGGALARRVTRPLAELAAGARRLAEGRFDRRLRLRSGDELQVLADTFDEMTDRLQANLAALEQTNQALARANAGLTELDRLKSDLLANVSHELRTPITAIKGYADYMLEGRLGPVTEKQRKAFSVMRRNLDRLARSVAALLDYSRLEEGGVSLTFTPFDLAALAEQIALSLRADLDRKGLGLTVDVEGGLPPVVADRERIGGVIENLVVNAIKFTPPEGWVLLRARRLAGDGPGQVEIEVADTGIGIPADQIEKVFQRFHQVDGSASRRAGGVGLGLAIVKSVLEAHGTSIRLESGPGQGTSFRFTLPLQEGRVAETPPRAKPEGPAEAPAPGRASA
jgi:signal transduction histidine kinase